jgi:hypothetical protein
MSEETTAPVEQPSTDTAAEVERLRQKNRELLDEAKKAKAKAAAVPDGVDVQELLTFKRQTEQAKLEAEGNFAELRVKLQNQYDTDTTALRAEIDQLKAKIRDLELISPAASELAKVCHDPEDVFKTGRLRPEQIETTPNGPVVADGLNRVPIADWARANLPRHYLKEPPARGTGAPVGGSVATSLPTGTNNPWVRASYNLTEQDRLVRINPLLAVQLKSEADAINARG